MRRYKEVEVLDDSQASNDFSKGKREDFSGDIDMKEQDLKGNDVFLNCNSISNHHSDNDSNDSEPGKEGEEDRE